MKINYKRLLVLPAVTSLVIITTCTLAPTIIPTPSPAVAPVPIPAQNPVLTPTSTPTLTPSIYTVNIASNTLFGNYLVDGRGRTLYYTVSDGPNYSNLPDEMLTVWRQFYVSEIIVPPSLNAADFGTFTRDNKVKQATYKGYPLYYFIQDKASGDALGNKQGGVWFVVNPGNFQP